MIIENLMLNHIVLSLAETIILDRLFAAFLTRNPLQNPKWYLAGMSGYFVFQLITYMADCPLFSTASLYLLFTVILSILFFSDNFQIKNLVSFLFVVLNYAVKVLSAVLVGRLENIPMPSMPSSLVLRPETQILACALFLIFISLIVWFRRLRVYKKVFSYNIITLVIPLGILILSIRIFSHVSKMNLSFLYLDISGILICTALALFYLLDKTAVIDEASEKNAHFEQMLNLQDKYYSEMEKSQQHIRSMRHDMKNHMRFIDSLLQIENYAEARDYIAEIYDRLENKNLLYHSGNAAVDIIVNQKLSRAEKSGVRVTTDMMLPSELPMESVDLCIVFGNLLDNAVEACECLSQNKEISVTARIKKDYLVIIISNTYNGILNIKNGIYKSVKTESAFRGIGLLNVEKVANKYSGEYRIAHDEKQFTVTVLLGLKNQNTKAETPTHAI